MLARVRTFKRCLAFGLLVLAGCGGSMAETDSTLPVDAQGGLAGEAASSRPNEPDDDELRAFVTDVIAPQLCPRLVGSFVGLPGEETAEGAAAGALPSAGRWWVRQCEASVVDGRLSFRIAGPGFTWVAQESQGFRVRQYLLFEAEASLTTELSLAYDADSRVASLWMAPIGDVTATITPRGALTAEATGLFSRVIGGILELTSANADARARAEAERIGSEQLRDRLGAGFTMTLALDRQQVDFMVGALPRGVTPQRPFPDEPGTSWILNQRSRIQRGGIDIVGPIPQSAEPLTLDFELEEGDGVVVRTACEGPVHDYLDARYRDAAAASTPPPPPGTNVLTATRVGRRHRVALPPASCARLLLIAPRTRSERPNRMRYRVLPRVTSSSEPSAPAASRAPASGESASGAPSLRYRIGITGITVRPENASGHDWDMIGGGPDLFVIVYSVPEGRELDRTPVADDTTEVRLRRFLPAVYEPRRHLPLRFVVMDSDATSDELIGTAELDASELARAREISLPLVSEGATAVQTGTIRLVIEPLR